VHLYQIQIWFGMAKKQNKNVELIHVHCEKCHKLTSPYSIGYNKTKTLLSNSESGIMIKPNNTPLPTWMCLLCFGGINLQFMNTDERVEYCKNIYNHQFAQNCFFCNKQITFDKGVWCKHPTMQKGVYVCTTKCVVSHQKKKKKINIKMETV